MLKYSNSVTRLAMILNTVGIDRENITQEAKDKIIKVQYREITLLEGTVNTIINSTKFEYLENETLKELLLSYPNELESFKTQENLISNIVNNKLKPIIEKHLSLKVLLPSNHPNYDRIRMYGATSNYYKLLSDINYQNIIIDRLLQTEIQISTVKSVYQQTRKMKDILEQKLK